MFKTPRIHKSFIALLVGTLALSISPALAMGTGNPYQDAQSGLTYVVYQPTYTSGLVLKSFKLPPNCHVPNSDSISATYGNNGKRYFFLTETSIKTICPMNMMLIRGATRTVTNKPGSGHLSGTQLVIISVGIQRVELNRIFASFRPKYKATPIK